MTATHKGVMYLNQHNVKSLMRLSEVNKFCDNTLVKIRENMIDVVTKKKLGKGNKRLKGRDWTDDDVMKSNEMVNKIDKTLKRREQLKRLEEDPRLLIPVLLFWYLVRDISSEGKRVMDPNSRIGKTCLGKKERKAFILHKIENEEASDRYVAPCFINALEAYDGEINLGKEENMISNEFAVKLCLDHEVKYGYKVVKKELIATLRRNNYFIKFIINPEEDNVDVEVVKTSQEALQPPR
ncbi:hypothetical protein Tco_1310945 [Tanacetum coccineum]